MKRQFFLLSISYLLCAPTITHADQVAEDCLRDLDTIPRFLLANDSGGKDAYAKHGEVYMTETLAETRGKAAKVSSEAECRNLLHDYVLTWRHDHISVASIDAKEESATREPVPEPTIKSLSDNTLVLMLPSFKSRYRDALATLLKERERELRQHKYWIIDVRKNSGGSDSTFAPLLPWLMDDEYQEVGVEFLATEKNFEATKNICERYEAGDEACKAMITPLLIRMRVANNGDFVPLNDSPISFIKHTDGPKQRARKVAVLTDKYCGSSCEQFLLGARQSFRVKLIGRNTAGALDYSNLRPYLLPSGKRELMYATSRSARLPNMPVDAAGIMPDIYLPPPVDDKAYEEEITRVKNWLEGGSLAPLQ